MAAKDNVVNVLSCFIVTATAVLVIDAAVENDRTFITFLKFKLKLTKADERSFSNLEMSLGTETAKREEIS